MMNNVRHLLDTIYIACNKLSSSFIVIAIISSCCSRICRLLWTLGYVVGCLSVCVCVCVVCLYSGVQCRADWQWLQRTTCTS